MKRVYLIVSACMMCLTFGISVLATADVAAAAQPGVIPAKAEPLSGVAVHSNTKAKIDASNGAEGYIMVSYTGGKKVKIKVQVQKKDATLYTYNLVNTGAAEVFPLNSGNGDYTVRVFENISGEKYALAYSAVISVTLRSEYLPFLYSNQFVSFAPTSEAVKTAAENTKDSKTNLERVEKIYQYVISTLVYDNDRAAAVTAGKMSGYVPVVDSVLKEKKGICFDYAALMGAMLRSSGIPSKMLIGYAGDIYHAWLNVYIEGVGWVDKMIYFDGKEWSLMDPTFISNARGDKTVQAFVSDKNNYAVKYVY